MSQKVYCTAQFLPKEGREKELFDVLKSLEPDTLREDGCLQYIVTKQIASPFADGKSFPIVFHEIWADMKSFETHCQRKEITEFFQNYCVSDKGLARDWNVCIYSDEG